MANITERTGYGIASLRNIPLNLEWYYTGYVKETLARKALPWRKVKKGECQHARDTLLQHFAATAESEQQFMHEKERIEQTWPTVEKYMHECPGLVSFMTEIGAHSRFFYPFLLDVPSGTAMLPAFFVGRDIFGKVQQIPTSDAMYRYCLNDPVFRSVRFRNHYEQQHLRNATQPITLAGGTLPQVWFDGFKLNPATQRLTVFDPDQGLMETLEQLFPGGLKEHGIDYHFQGFERALLDPRHIEAHDLTTAMGLGSYNTKKLDELFDTKAKLTMPGGTILIDFQVMCVPLIFDRFVLHWKTERPMKPSRNVKEITRTVLEVCKRNGRLSVVEQLIAPGGAGVVFKISKK